mmetsp:Transcript_19331/g.60045  ORF Transcript_19331/g.60045 Transcript_19331/m.60045 type:complete len:225 (+) Transcript_19331:964-1638(+)
MHLVQRGAHGLGAVAAARGGHGVDVGLHDVERLGEREDLGDEGAVLRRVVAVLDEGEAQAARAALALVDALRDGADVVLRAADVGAHRAGAVAAEGHVELRHRRGGRGRVGVLHRDGGDGALRRAGGVGRDHDRVRHRHRDGGRAAAAAGRQRRRARTAAGGGKATGDEEVRRDRRRRRRRLPQQRSQWRLCSRRTSKWRVGSVLLPRSALSWPTWLSCCGRAL